MRNYTLDMSEVYVTSHHSELAQYVISWKLLLFEWKLRPSPANFGISGHV